MLVHVYAFVQVDDGFRCWWLIAHSGLGVFSCLFGYTLGTSTWVAALALFKWLEIFVFHGFCLTVPSLFSVGGFGIITRNQRTNLFI